MPPGGVEECAEVTAHDRRGKITRVSKVGMKADVCTWGKCEKTNQISVEMHRMCRTERKKLDGKKSYLRYARKDTCNLGLKEKAGADAMQD